MPAKGGNAPTSDAGDAGEAVLLLLVLALPVLPSRVGGEPAEYSVLRRGRATVEVGGDAVAADPKLWMDEELESRLLGSSPCQRGRAGC